MKYTKAIRECIIYVVAWVFFYEGLWLLQHQNPFSLWLQQLPLLHSIHEPIALAWPLAEITVALLLLWPATRQTGMVLALTGCLALLVYLILALQWSTLFFLPFHPYWKFMKWFHKMLLLLAAAWTMWILLLYQKQDACSNPPTLNRKI